MKLLRLGTPIEIKLIIMASPTIVSIIVNPLHFDITTIP
jgi:hypothetical protein